MLTPQLFFCFVISFSVVSAQSEGTCVGRCGQGYFRGDPCHCDYNCMSYMECCPDFKAVCTTEGSCQGRCHEGFIRGQTCDCDPSCVGYGKCCPDYEEHCAKPVPRKPSPPPRLPDPAPKDESPKPTRKPEEREAEPAEEEKNKKPKDDDDDDPKNPKSPKVREGDDDPDNPETPPKEPRNPSDNGDKPKEPKEPKDKEKGDDTEGPDKKPKEPTPDDKDGKPKKPTVKDGDNPEDPNDPNQKSPDDKDGKPKTEKPKPKDDDSGPEDPGKTPKGRSPKSPRDEDNNPKKQKTSEITEETEEETEDSENSPRKPSPADKGKKNPIDDKPNKKKKGNPEDDADNEPLQPGKGKKPKKKPSPKDIVKKKKKIDSEEERQETVESEYSSSSQSSSSHSRSKSTRRLTGKNKKNIKEKNKKKFPDEEPENPLMPPKRKTPLPTPVYTTPDEGSGDDGSGMDFLQTTIVSTTVRLNTTTNMPTTVGTKKTEGTSKPSNPQTESTTEPSNKATTNMLINTSTGTQSTGSSATTTLYPQSSTTEEKSKEAIATTSTTTQMSTLKTPQDQSTAESSVKHTTQSPGLEETAAQQKSTPMGPTKHTPPSSDLVTSSSYSSPGKDGKTPPNIQTTDRSTVNINKHSTTSAPLTTLDPNKNQSPTEDPMDGTDVTSSTNPTTRNAKDTTENSAFKSTTSAKPDQSGKMTTRQPDIGQTTEQPGQRPVPVERRYETTTKPNHSHRDSFTTIPLDENETGKATTPHTIHPHHICNMIKDEATKLRIPESDLKHITEICAELELKYPNVNIPTTQPRQPNIDDKEVPPRNPLSEGTPSIWYQPPGSRLIQILVEIHRRMNNSPTTNLTGILIPNTHKWTSWLMLINKLKLATDPQLNLCIGPPADGMTTLQNGSMVVFRGHYFWTLNQGGIAGMPRKISEVWGIPSPVDTVFTRCNCGGKTFFFKGPLYWRFTNDVMDKGYPKEIIKGFGGLRGKVTAVLSVARIKTRPESVYFFKPGGNVQKYTFRQEQTKRCTKKKQPSVNYPIYSQRVQTVRFRFPRDIVRHRIEIRRTFTNIPQPLGFLHEEKTVRSTWRGIPSNIVSAVSLPNPLKQDGFDYFVFTKDKYYNINMSSKVAIKPPAQAEQKTTKDFYKCKE